MAAKSPTASTMRWKLLRQAFLPSRNRDDEGSQKIIDSVSRKAKEGFNLIPCRPVESPSTENSRDVCLCYSLLPVESAPKLFLFQRENNYADINDFEICNKYNIDNTGLVCRWPSEEVLAYYCLSHPDIFRSKRVMELGSGYGLAGLVIAATSEASQVVISDGNPQVINYIQRSIAANSGVVGSTRVEPMILHWNEEDLSTLSNSFDIIVASDCTFFKEFHKALAQTVKTLLRHSDRSEAIFFSPQRGDSLDKFLEEITAIGLHFCVSKIYDSKIWRRHQELMEGDESWPNYEMDHCYPLLIRIMW